MLSGPVATTFTCHFNVAQRAGVTARLQSFGSMSTEEMQGLREYIFSGSRIPSEAGFFAPFRWRFGDPMPGLTFLVETLSDLTITSTNTVDDMLQLTIDIFYCSSTATSFSRRTLHSFNSSALSISVGWLLPNEDTSIFDRSYQPSHLQMAPGSVLVDLSTDGSCFRVRGNSAFETINRLTFKSLLVSIDISPSLQSALDHDTGFWHSQSSAGMYLAGTVQPGAPATLSEIRVSSAPVFDACPTSLTMVVDELVLQPVVTWPDLWVQLSDNNREQISSINQVQGARRWNLLPINLKYIATNGQGLSTVCTVDLKVVSSKWIVHKVREATIDSSLLTTPEHQANGLAVLQLASNLQPGAFVATKIPIYNTHVYSWVLNAPRQQAFEVVGDMKVVLHVYATFRLLTPSNASLNARDGSLSVSFLNISSMSSGNTVDTSFTQWLQFDSASGVIDSILTLNTVSVLPRQLQDVQFSGIAIGLRLPIGVETAAVGVLTDWNDTATLLPQTVDVRLQFEDSSVPAVQIVNLDKTPPVIQCPADIRITLEKDQDQVTIPQTLLQPALLTDDMTQSPLLDEVPLSTYSAGLTTVTLTAADEAGNKASCTFLVAVEATPNTARSSAEFGSASTAGMAAGLCVLLLFIVCGMLLRHKQRRYGCLGLISF